MRLIWLLALAVSGFLPEKALSQEAVRLSCLVQQDHRCMESGCSTYPGTAALGLDFESSSLEDCDPRRGSCETYAITERYFGDQVVVLQLLREAPNELDIHVIAGSMVIQVPADEENRRLFPGRNEIRTLSLIWWHVENLSWKMRLSFLAHRQSIANRRFVFGQNAGRTRWRQQKKRDLKRLIEEALREAARQAKSDEPKLQSGRFLEFKGAAHEEASIKPISSAS